MVELPQLRLDEGTYEYPKTESLHENLVQAAVEQEQDLCIITPTLRAEYLDYHILAALFQKMGELDPVFVITPNTAVRDRYEQFRNGMQYSTAKWPLSTVKADGSLAERTQHARSDEAPPAVIFTRYSTRLPHDEISQDIRAVLYDDAVKFEDERWEEFQSWRNRNDVPAVIYFIRDPLGDVYQNVKNDVDSVWAWSQDTIREIIDSDTSPQQSTVPDGGTTVPSCTYRERELLNLKTEGQSHQLYLCTDSPIVEAFSEVWDAYEALQEAADDIELNEVWRATGVTKRAIAGFSRLLSALEYSDNYRADHGNAVPLSGRIGQVKRVLENLEGDAAAARTPVEHVHHALSELQDTIVDGEPGWWKRGAVLKAMQQVVERDESLIVVAPDTPARDALRADLQIERETFYSQARSAVSISAPEELPQADPADHLLFYGPPKYDHRWLLRAPNAAEIGVLAYPHELGLLHSQVRQLNREMRKATPTPEGSSQAPNSIVNQVIAASSEGLQRAVSQHSDSSSSPTDCGSYDGISIDIPDQEEIEAGDVSESAEFDDYRLVSTDPDDSIDDIIEDAVTDFQESTSSFTPGAFTSAGTSDRSSPSSSGEQIEGCIDIRVKKGKGIVLRPGDKIEAVNPEAGTTVEKPASGIQPGEKVVAVHDRDAIRDAVEQLLLDSGYIDLVGYARLWKNQLQTEIARRDDSLDEFIERVEEQGIDKYRGTYRDWYNGEINLPKAKKSLYALAEAYEMEEVLDDFENVWKANHRIRTIKNDLIDLLKKRAQNVLSEDNNEDLVLDEELDVRLSDFETTDEEGNDYVQVHLVTDVVEDCTVARSYIGRWRDL